MTRNLDIDGLNCLCADCPGNRIIYILYPMDILAPWIENVLTTAGIDVSFIGVPGNHFSDPTGRLDKALAALGR